MTNIIVDTVLNAWTSRHKTKLTPSKWYSGNAVCCTHNGTTMDKKGRGGMIVHQDSISYSCFNCGFTASWQPPRKIGRKMKDLMLWLDIPNDVINHLTLTAWRLSEGVEITNAQSATIPSFITKQLPTGAKRIDEYTTFCPKLIEVLEYLNTRKLYLDDYTFYWSPTVGTDNRLIIPYYYRNMVVGYAMRAINEAKQRYIVDQQPHYVFNLDNQNYDKSFVIVTEGPFDAISIGGTAILGSNITSGHNYLLSQLNKEIILVPDRDLNGYKTIIQALEYNWTISLPDWPEGVKDVNDAVVKMGRLATLYLIINSKFTNILQVKQRATELYRAFDTKGIKWPQDKM